MFETVVWDMRIDPFIQKQPKRFVMCDTPFLSIAICLGDADTLVTETQEKKQNKSCEGTKSWLGWMIGVLLLRPG